MPAAEVDVSADHQHHHQDRGEQQTGHHAVAPHAALAGAAGGSRLVVGGRAAAELLSSITSERLNAAVGTRIVAETSGNPLALVELARELSPEQLAGSAALPEPLPAGDTMQKMFSPRLSRLPPQARLLVAIAAAEPTAPQARLWRVAEQLGVDPEAAAPAVKDLVEFTPQVVFRHPLVRSAAYHLTPLSQRRLIHQALADASDPSEQPDRVAWHLGIAALGPDDAVAAQLEQAASRARERGGFAATATFLSRAAELSVDEGLRARRLLTAAEAELAAGASDRAAALLGRVRVGAVTELQAGSYVFMDAFHGSLVPGFAVSLTVLTTVLARHGDTVIFDAGRKSVGIDFVLPPIQGYDYQARYYAEEHALFDTDPGFPAQIGDRARLICGYAPTTVNLHDVIFTIDGDLVTGVWPVFPRGPGHSGFLTALRQAD